jgi:hypothetical protein
MVTPTAIEAQILRYYHAEIFTPTPSSDQDSRTN